MARGMDHDLTLEERLDKVNSEIEAAEQQLKQLQKQKADLERHIQMARKEYISSRGLSRDEAQKL